jgi:hypothetical protein
MRKLGLALGLIILSFCVACGGGSSSTSGGGPTPQGSYTNASLSGSYFYQLKGTDLNTGAAFTEAGVFTSDGNGNITSGTDDFTEGGGISTDSISGTYVVRNDGVSLMTVNFGAGGSITLAFTLLSSSRAYLIEDDGFLAAAGSAVKQDTTAFSAAPNGTFAFRTHTSSPGSQGSTSSVGVMTVASGVVNSGNEDVLRGGSTSQLTLTAGSLNVPDATGRGTGTFTDSTLQTYVFTYYVVDANNLRMLITSLNGVSVAGAGSAVAQSGGPFTAASLTGSYAFGSKGDTLTVDGIGTVGRFTSDGSGNISAGEYDSNRDGVPSTSDVTFTGSYTMGSNGRGNVTLLPSIGGSIHDIFYMVSPSRAFFLTDDPTKVEDGTADTQQPLSYSTSILSGQFAFLMHGFTTTPDTFDRVGTLTPDGAGNIGFTYFLNVSFTPSTSPISLSGTYTIGASGRGTGTATSLSNNLVYYLISASDGYILQNDTGVVINGNMSKQQ